MDMKGISWIGNFYQKFEAMCLEVEEIVYQDTVKYVENQVQTVGSSVKRFYSDVMQDLLPPSSVDAAKGGDSNLPLDFYGDVGIYMKPKIGMNEKNSKTDDVKKEDFTGGVSRQNNKGNLCNKSNLRTRKCSKRENSFLDEQAGSVTRLDEDMNRISLFCEPSSENHLRNSTPLVLRQNVQRRLSRKSSEESRNDTHSGKDLIRAFPICVLSNENRNSFHQEAKTTTPRFAEETWTDEESQNETEVDNEQIAVIPSDEPSSGMAELDENGMRKEMDMRGSSGSASLVEANAANICTYDVMNSLVESCSNWQLQSEEIAGEEDFLFSSGRSNGWNTELNEVDASFVSEMEVIQQVDEGKLEESCIVVNRDGFHCVPCYEGKSKSYRKKIRDVFSPRKSSGRKHEYEQLARWPVGESNLKKEECVRNVTPSLTIKDGKRSSTADTCEAEWELL